MNASRQEAADEVCFIAMQPWLLTALLLASFTAMAVGQMAEPAAVDLERGLVIRRLEPVALSPGKDGLPGSAGIVAPSGATIKLSDFTLCCSLEFEHEPGGDHSQEFCYLQGKDHTLLILAASPDCGIVLRQPPVPGQIVGGLPLAPRTRRKIDVAVTIKRDPRQALSGLWIDGGEHASFNMPPGADELDVDAVLIGAGMLRTGIVSNIRLYNRALSRPEIIALAEQSQPKPKQEVIAIIGGTEAVALAESGWLETYLNLSRVWTANDTKPIVRDLAWEGDTVFEQKRPLNFGSLAQQLERVQAKRTVVIVGRQECLDRGADGLSVFREALTKLVQQCPRGAVIVGAVPFEKKEAPLPDLAAKNELLARYDDAMRAVAEATGGTFVDTAGSWRKQTEAWTRDGLTLNDHGARTLADIIAFHLGNTSADPPAADLANLRKLAVQKHALWHRYWRPSNWAFLYGDRTAQPSSRDHLNPNVRWFPQELEQYRSLIEAKEDELWKLSQDLGRKLP